MSLVQQTVIPAKQERFALLDISRAVAALAVVVYHWQHFRFAPYDFPPGYDYRVEPFAKVLSVLYLNGYMAVDYFFILSGFIFFRKYQSPIYNGKVRGREFFILRLSRLYPLHFLTLLIVCVFQWLYFLRHDRFFVHPFNDAYHFVLQLFFASQWGLQKGPSYNDVVWSLSIEVLLYALFFFLTRRWRMQSPAISAWMLLGFVLMSTNLASGLGRGLFGFFAGGLISHAILRKESKTALWKEAAFYTWFAVALAVNIVVFTTQAFSMAVDDSTQAILAIAPHLTHLADKLHERIFRIGQYVLVIVFLFPAVVASFVLVERRLHRLFSRFDFLGNLSYSTYLWHFPLMLAMALYLPGADLLPDSQHAVALFIVFFAVLIAVSFASYYWIEAPMQRVMRLKLLGKRRTKADMPPPVSAKDHS